MSENTSGFFQGSFKSALRQAKKSKRPLVVDFFTDWCPPCNMLDENLWPDPEVQAFLTDEVVALKINAETEIDLTQEYAIEAYPSILIMDSTGKELDRLVGYMEPEAFLEEARGILSGKDSVERAKAQLVGDKANSPMARMHLARKLKEQKRYDESLSEYLWCFDEGEKHEPAFIGVRGSFLLTEVAELAKVHEPAREALIERRDDARSRVLNSTAGEADISEYSALNNALDQKHDTLLMYDTLRARAGVEKSIMLDLYEAAIPILLEHKRYQDVLDGAESLDEKFTSTVESILGTTPPEDQEIAPEMLAMIRSFLMSNLARYYEALLGTGRKQEANAWCDRILAFDAHPMTFMSLIQAAKGASAMREADALLARAKYEVSAENFEQMKQDLAIAE